MLKEQISNTDISEHLPTLRLLVSLCDHVTEFGVRSGVSTQAFLTTNVPSIHYDIDPQPFAFPSPHSFIQADTLKIDIQPTDLLFIDTEHSYEQLSQELALHANKVRKYLVFHDTTTYDEALTPAIVEFLKDHKDWKLLAQYLNNNGLTVLVKGNEKIKSLPMLKKLSI